MGTFVTSFVAILLFLGRIESAPAPSPVLYYSRQNSNNYNGHNNYNSHNNGYNYNNVPVEFSYSDASGYLVQGEVQEDIKCSSGDVDYQYRHAWAYYENRSPMYYNNLINCLTSKSNPDLGRPVANASPAFASVAIIPQTACSTEEQYSHIRHTCVEKTHNGLKGVVG